MKCPACERELKEIMAGEIAVDVCDNGCGGVWFDNFELQKIHKSKDASGVMLLDIKKDPDLTVDMEKKRLCPRCPSQKMMRRFYGVKRDVEIDECPACSGIWLDYGELGTIFNSYGSADEKQQAAQEYMSKVFGEKSGFTPDKVGKRSEKSGKIPAVLRFLIKPIKVD